MTAGDEGRPGGWVPTEPAAPVPVPPTHTTEPDTQPVTRASLRAAREARARQGLTRPGARLGTDAADDDAAVPSGPPAVVTAAVTGVALALLLGLAGFAGGLLTALATAFAAVVMVWGWSALTAAPSPRSATVVVGAGALATCVTVLLTRTEPRLVWVPAAVAVSVVAAMLHQVLRPHGRPRLTEGLASSISVLALTACGVPLIALTGETRGGRWVAVAMAAAAVVALLVLGLTRAGAARWVLGATVVLGTGAAVLAATLVTGVPLVAAAVLGLLVSAVAHSLLRVLFDLPGAARVQGAAAAGAASVLVVGVLVYLVARVVAG